MGNTLPIAEVVLQEESIFSMSKPLATAVTNTESCLDSPGLSGTVLEQAIKAGG